MFNVLKITAKTRDLPHHYAVYSLSTNEMHYVGVCKVSELFAIPDARQNSLYPVYFPIECLTTLEIHYINEIRSNCLIHAAQLIHKYNPIMNVRGFAYDGNNSPITCNETGEVFQTLEDVVRIHGGNTGNLSKHLQKKPGHRSVNGKTYRRGPATDEIILNPAPLKQIKNITTGEVFKNSAAVAKKYNVTSGAVSNHLAGRLKHLKGNIFTYL